MSEDKSNALTWNIILYVMSALMVLFTVVATYELKAFVPALYLIPMLLLLLPVLRNKIKEKIKFFPGPGWSLILSTFILTAQAIAFGDAADEATKAAESKRQSDSQARIAKMKGSPDYRVEFSFPSQV